MSDFAKAQLLKYGWTEGKGLGKNENGIAEALRPKLKFDTSGVGHKDLEFEWWESVYDKALKNIVLDKKSDKVSIKVAKENAFNISSTKYGLEVSKKKHSLHYGKFLKTSTLQDGNLINDSSCQPTEEEPRDIQSVTKMSDEELFKVCGGRTAHKGARHGLTLNGKLARIAEQEKQLIAAGYLKSKVESSDKNETKLKRKKKKKRDIEMEHSIFAVQNEIIAEANDDCVVLSTTKSDSDYKPSKKTCKKVKRKIHNLSQQLTKSCMIEDDAMKSEQETTEEKEPRKKCKSKKKKSKRKRDQEIAGNVINDIQLNNDTSMEPSTKKFKKHKSLLELSTSIVVDNNPSLNCVPNGDQIEPVKMHSKCKKEKGHHRSKDHKFSYCTKTEALRLNHKIKLKKSKTLKRKEKKTYGKLVESLLAVSLDADPSEESNK
ncbi:hypothetical protein TSAR_012321 [Trichomalopsis sarcophagae]|uniref:G patch domain-containing protein 4 n=1 Tax=Trichomalopsis sarcophagae TaxID=543379 RepID=A0A232EQ18_9HYME|nr:hypothetical protein TSAR_012321 [Trichomalopsis sarcophagae]